MDNLLLSGHANTTIYIGRGCIPLPPAAVLEAKLSRNLKPAL